MPCFSPDPTNAPIAIGVSSCLLGERVRYDGGHKLAPYITDCLGSLFRLVPVCPETGCGMPTPREAMRLEGDPAAPRLVTIKSRIDLTDQMLAWCRMKVGELEGDELCGFILKKGSPSCGLRVEVCNEDEALHYGRGLFAAAVMERFPLLPVVEEGYLDDPICREEFIQRVVGYGRKKA